MGVSFECIHSSGNNINIQVQGNTGNDVEGQSGGDGDDHMYSDSPILQEQLAHQASSVISK